ncbi:unnamed protein product [Owenia fusiformis]|uniref:Uncharacterized protein n=1 Tax=Owenia fusiformis TaxID=6347 RepID=A0A8J1T535_OWEFU|nr:unnamed protein product [Owenia fusiformis]
MERQQQPSVESFRERHQQPSVASEERPLDFHQVPIMASPSRKTTSIDITQSRLYPSNQSQSSSHGNCKSRAKELEQGEETMLDTTLPEVNRTPSPYYHDDADDDVFVTTDTRHLLSPPTRDVIPSPMTSTPRVTRIPQYPHNSSYTYAALDSGLSQPSLPHYKPNKSSTNNMSSSVSSKRYRQRRMFTTDQLLLLEDNFETMPYPKNADFAHLEDLTGIDGSSLRIWFQNRRVKARKNGQTGIRSTVGRPCKQVPSNVPGMTTYEQMTQIKLPPNHPFCVIDGSESMSTSNDETCSLSPNDSVEVRSMEVIKKQKTQWVGDHEFIAKDRRLHSIENRMSDIFPTMTSSPIISGNSMMPFPFPLMGVPDHHALKGNVAMTPTSSEQPLDLSVKTSSPRPGIQRPWEDAPKKSSPSSSNPTTPSFAYSSNPTLVSLMQYQYATAMHYANIVQHASIQRSSHH